MSETQAYQIIDHSYDVVVVGAGGSLRWQRAPAKYHFVGKWVGLTHFVGKWVGLTMSRPIGLTLLRLNTAPLRTSARSCSVSELRNLEVL